MPAPDASPSLGDVSFTNPLETLGLSRDIVREFANEPERVQSLAKALYKARSMDTHSDRGGSDSAQIELNDAWAQVESAEAIRLLISDYIRITNIQGERDQLKAALGVKQKEVGALTGAIVRMIETSARGALGMLGEERSVETLHGCAIKLRDDGMLLRTGQILAGGGYDMTEADSMQGTVARMKEVGKDKGEIAKFEGKRREKDALSQRTVKVDADGKIRDQETTTPRVPAICLVIPLAELSREVDLPFLLKRAGLKIEKGRALGSGAASGPSKADDYNTTSIPAANLSTLGRYLEKGIRPSGDDKVYLFSSYLSDAGMTLFYLEGRVDSIEGPNSSKPLREPPAAKPAGAKPKRAPKKS
jgi:hypothetical protein